jgi:hypothetical protein
LNGGDSKAVDDKTTKEGVAKATAEEKATDTGVDSKTAEINEESAAAADSTEEGATGNTDESVVNNRESDKPKGVEKPQSGSLPEKKDGTESAQADARKEKVTRNSSKAKVKPKRKPRLPKIDGAADA